MIKNVNLKTRLITHEDFTKIQNFKCGNTSIENFLKQEAYYLTITKECSTTLVFDQSELVGFFSLTKSSLHIEIAGEMIDFPCLDIARIATAKNYQKQGFGTAMLNMIFNIANTVNERFITLEALIENYDWYVNRGFIPLVEKEAIHSNPDGLVFMLVDLYDERLGEKYFEE